MLTIPSVDDWYRLSLKYREFHRSSDTVLKDYGYMAIMDYLETQAAKKILEFGHGFNPTLFVRYGKARNVWGVDAYQGLHYFPDRAEWEKRFEQEVRSKAPECTFRRGLLGGDGGVDLPDNYFDVICSVSVLEEVPMDVVRDILKHVVRLLKPGGALIGTHDLLTAAPERIGEYIDAHAAVGLDLQIETFSEINNKTLIENPSVAMIHYQMGQPEENRKYWGHWATMWTVATKPRGSGFALWR